MSCIIMGKVQCISVVLAVFITNTIFRNLRRKSTFFTNFFNSNCKMYKISVFIRCKQFCINIEIGNMNYLDLKSLNDLIFKMRQHNETAYKWPYWEHIIDHISKTGNVSSLKFSSKQDLTMPFCITL